MKEQMYYTEVSGKYAAGELWKKVRPKETREYLHNPHKGITTFQHFNGDPVFVERWSEEGPVKFNFRKRNPVFDAKWIPTTVAYCRWFWTLVEPEEGKYDFSVIENSLKTCGVTGQTLMARVMPFGAPGQPKLPLWYTRKYPVKNKPHKGGDWYEPEYEGKDYLRCWSRLHKELGKRFNKHPLLDTYDAGYLGWWGEGDGVMSVPQINKFVKMYLSCFDRKKILGEFAGIQFREIIKHGTGWRANSWGDIKNAGAGAVPNGLGWNHYYDAYPEWVIGAGAREAWKYAPVHMEGSSALWYQNNMPLEMVDMIMEQALKLHVTGLNAGYIIVPDKWRARFMELTERLGYRFVPRYFKFKNTLDRGNKFYCETWIDNTGVAPIYRDLYAYAFRFRQGRKQVIVRSKQDITAWMPEYNYLKETLTIPSRFHGGEIKVDAALVDKKTNLPKVRFGIGGMAKDGWYPLGSIRRAV